MGSTRVYPLYATSNVMSHPRVRVCRIKAQPFGKQSGFYHVKRASSLYRCRRLVPAIAFGATPNSQFQYSALSGSTNTIVASRVPVVTATGAVVYKDIRLLFVTASDGKLVLAPGYPSVENSPNLVVSAFKPGNYVGPSTILGGAAKITVSGPGVAPGGATQWSLSTSTGASQNTYPSSASWYVGPIASNPLAARLRSAGITSTAWSYGVGGGGGGYGAAYDHTYYSWRPGSLIGVSQSGNAVTIFSFTYNGTDHATPVDQITYTLRP